MNMHFMTRWGIPIISLVVFSLTFFIFFRETQEIFSSLTAAILGALMIFGTLIVVSWIVQALHK
jgi:hypothetical protein